MFNTNTERSTLDLQCIVVRIDVDSYCGIFILTNDLVAFRVCGDYVTLAMSVSPPPTTTFSYP